MSKSSLHRHSKADLRYMRQQERAEAAFAFTPPAVEGAPAIPYGGPSVRDRDLQLLAESRDARFGRLTYGAGPTLPRYSTYPASGLTPDRVTSILQSAETTGICWQKADLTLQVLQKDSHLTAADRTIRYRIAGADWRIRPYDDSDEAQDLAAIARAMWHGTDAMESTLFSLLLSHADGYSVAETVDREDEVLHIRSSPRAGNGGLEHLEIRGDWPRCIPWVHNKVVRFEPGTEEPVLDMGHGKVISIPEGKVIYTTALGDGLVQSRGHINSTAYLHTLTHNAVVRWAVYLAQFGIDNVAYVVDRAKYQDVRRRAEYTAWVENIGNGIPSVMTDEGKLEITKAPSGGTSQGIHAAMIGWANNEKSKRVQGEQLTMEVGGNGAGYNTSETQAQMQDAWVRAISKHLAGELRARFISAYFEKNMVAISTALGIPPSVVRRKTPWLVPHTQRPVSPAVMVQVLAQARNDLGMDIDDEEARELIGLNPARPGHELPGRAIPLPKGAAAVAVTDAQQPGGTLNPDPGDQAAATKPTTGQPEASAAEPSKDSETKAPENKGARVELTATDLGTIITVNEARADYGKAPLPEDGDLTIAEYKAKHGAVVAEAARAEEGAMSAAAAGVWGGAATSWALSVGPGLRPMAAMVEQAAQISGAVREELKRGIRWYEEGKAGDGLEKETVEEARRLLREGKWWPAKVRKANRFFGRNDRYENEMDHGADPDPQRVSWALWGGTAGRSQVESLVKVLDDEDKED